MPQFTSPFSCHPLSPKEMFFNPSEVSLSLFILICVVSLCLIQGFFLTPRSAGYLWRTRKSDDNDLFDDDIYSKRSGYLFRTRKDLSDGMKRAEYLFRTRKDMVSMISNGN